MPPKTRLTQRERGMRAQKGSAATEGAKGFISFSDVSAASSFSSPSSYSSSSATAGATVVGEKDTTQNLSPVYIGDDVELSVICKKLSKKNPVSRLKALHELKSVLEKRGDSVLPELSSFFVFIYNRLVLENQANIREEANSSLEMMMRINKKLFATHMTHLIAPWYFSTCDSSREIGARAQSAMEVAFPPKKRREVLTHFSAVILRYLFDNILNSTPETFSDASKVSSTEAEDTYERVISISFSALARFLGWLYPSSSVESDPHSAKANSPLPLPNQTTELLSHMLNISFFKKTVSKRNFVRRGALEVLAVVCEHCSHFLEMLATSTDKTFANGKSKPDTLSALYRLSMVVQNALINEMDTYNISVSLRSFHLFCKAMPQAWDHMDLYKVLNYMKELSCRQESIFEDVLTYVLPIVATVPFEEVQKNKSSLLGLIDSVSTTGLSQSQIGYNKNSVAVFEICTFLIIQQNKYNKVTVDDQFSSKLIQLSIDHFVRMCQHSDNSNHKDYGSLIVPLFRALHKAHWSSGSRDSCLMKEFWDAFSNRVILEMSFFVDPKSRPNETHGDVEAVMNFIGFVMFCALEALKASEWSDSNQQNQEATELIGLTLFLNKLYKFFAKKLPEFYSDQEDFSILVCVYIFLGYSNDDCKYLPNLGVSAEDFFRIICGEWVTMALGNGSGYSKLRSKCLIVSFSSVSRYDEAMSTHYSETLLLACIDSHSLEGLNIAFESGILSEAFLKSSRSSAITQHIQKCVVALCVSRSSDTEIKMDACFISKINANLKSSQVKFLVKCQSHHLVNELTGTNNLISDNITANLKDASMTISRSNCDVCITSLLSYAYLSCKKDNCNEAWCHDSSLIIAALLVKFFSQRKDEGSLDACPQEHGVINSWDSIELLLLPVLTHSLLDEFISSCVKVLNARLYVGLHMSERSSKELMLSMCPGLLSSESLNMIDSETWCRYAKTIYNFSRQSLSHFLTLFDLNKPSLWKALEHEVCFDSAQSDIKLCEAMSFIVQCIFQLDSNWPESEVLPTLLPLAWDVDLIIAMFKSIMSVKSMIDRSHSSRELDTAEVGCVDDLKDQVECSNALVYSCTSKDSDLLKAFLYKLIVRQQSLCCSFEEGETDAMQYRNEFEAIAVATRAALGVQCKENEIVRRLSLDTPTFFDTLEKGSNNRCGYVHVIKKNAAESEINEEYCTLSLEPSTLLKLHKDDGPDNPVFCSIQCRDKEIQTEARRIILRYNVESGNTSDHRCFDTVGRVDRRKLTDKLEIMMFDWLARCTKKHVSSTGSSDCKLREEMVMCGNALQTVLSVSASTEGSSEIPFVSHCRQCCIDMIVKNLIEQSELVLFGLEVLCSILTCAQVIGNGLWVVTLLLGHLESVYRRMKDTSRLVLSQNTRHDILIQLCRILSVLIDRIANRDLIRLATNVTGSCLDSLNNANSSLPSYHQISGATVNLLATLWHHSSECTEKTIVDWSIGNEFESSTELTGEKSWSSTYHFDFDALALRHCFKTLFHELFISEGSDPSHSRVDVVALATGIDTCLQNQIRRGGSKSCVVLLQACGLALLPKEECGDAATADEECGDKLNCANLFSLSLNPHINPMIRVLLTKVLDIAFTSQSFLSSSTQDITPPTDLDEEKDENAFGESLSRASFGNELYSKFCQLSLKVRERALRSTSEIDTEVFRCSSCGEVFEPRLVSMQSLDILLRSSSINTIFVAGMKSSCMVHHCENCNDMFGLILASILMLRKLDTLCMLNKLGGGRATVGQFLTQSSMLIPLLRLLLDAHAMLPAPKGSNQAIEMLGKQSPSAFNRVEGNDSFSEALRSLCDYALYRLTCLLPVATRTFWNEHCNRAQRSLLEKFIESKVNKHMVKREIAIVQIAERQGRLKSTAGLSGDLDDGITIRCSAVSQEFITTFTADEVSVEMIIRLPVLYPLRNVEVECTKKMGIAEGRWRRWILQIVQLLSHQDGSVLDAILLWKQNVDKEFEGVEPCPICYSILHPKTMSLPTLCCSTCKNKFHSPCLYKWFNSSGKSKCVLCQQPFF